MPKRRQSRRNDGIVITDRWKSKGRREGRQWMVRVRDPNSGRYQQKSFDRIEDGREWARQMRARFELGQATAKTVTLMEVGEIYLDHLRGRGRTERHLGQVAQVLEDLAAGGVSVLTDELLPRKLERFVTRLQKRRGTGPASISMKNKFIKIAKAVSRFAAEWRYTPYDLLAPVKPFQATQPKKEVYTIAELKRLLAPENRDHELYDYFVLMIYLGCRPSEAAAVTWNLFDWDNETVTLEDPYRRLLQSTAETLSLIHHCG